MRPGVRSPSAPPKKQMVTCNFDGQLFGAGRQHFGPTQNRKTPPYAAGIDTCGNGNLLAGYITACPSRNGGLRFSPRPQRFRNRRRSAATPRIAKSENAGMGRKTPFYGWALGHDRGVPGRSSAGAPDLSSVARRVVRKSLPLTGRFLEGLKPPGWKHPPLIILQLRS